MAVAPTPEEIYRRAVTEGQRRLEASLLEQVATGFIAGFNIVFGVVTFGIVHALVEPRFGAEIAQLAGALGFAIGLVFLVVGRSELFTENFFGPVATAFERRDRGRQLVRLGRVWSVVLVLNLIGGAMLALILSTEGSLPDGTSSALGKAAEEISSRRGTAAFANAIAGGALVTLLSFLLQAVDQVSSRIAVSFLVGFLLAVGPFNHVVVTAIHLFFGILFDAAVSYETLAATTAVAVAGNLIGGIAFVTLTHVAQAKGSS